jgi:hypothetical protein
VDNGFTCAACGQWNNIGIDPSAGRRQEYVEDCQVCCRPNRLQIWYDEEEHEYVVTSETE